MKTPTRRSLNAGMNFQPRAALILKMGACGCPTMAAVKNSSALLVEWYNSSMKEKTSITLSSEVLMRIDQLAGSSRSRSAFIEKVLRRYLRERERAAVQARDLERINRAAEQLNSEAADVMDYQTIVE